MRSHDSDSDTTSPDWLRGPICGTARQPTFKLLQAALRCRLPTACAPPHRSAQQARQKRCRLQAPACLRGCAQRQFAAIPSAKAGPSPTTRSLRSGIAQECALRAAFPIRYASSLIATRAALQRVTLNEPPVPLDESLNPPPARRVVANRRVAPGVLSDESDGDKPTSSGFVVAVAPSP